MSDGPPAVAPRAVFLSYAREDTDAARRVADALRAFGVEVWLDQEGGLEHGDEWDRKIRQQIKACALFLPIISANTQARREGYFRIEWELASERAVGIAHGVPFILPILIDATNEPGALVPDRFRRVQWTRLPAGETPAAFVARVQKLLGGEGAGAPSLSAVRPFDQAQDRPAHGPSSEAKPTATSKSGPLVWAVVALAAGLLALGAYVVMRPSAKEAAPTAQPVAESKPSSPLPAAQPPPDFAVAKSEDKSIAVLPFENQSDDKENTAFFSDGMHEDILTNLANLRELRVVSRTSVLQYRNTKKPIPQIARELGVAYVLEGSVRRAGNQVRITGQLIRAATDEHLWAKSYDRELTPKEMFAIQAALSTEIAGALRLAISPHEKSLVERRPTENLAAYDLYLKANPNGPRPSRARLIEIQKLLEEAVRLDPNFAEAWGRLGGRVHAAFVLNGWDHTPARLAQADAAIARAVRLAPDLPEVILSFGRYSMGSFRDYAHASEQFQRVIRLQPNNAAGYYNLGNVQRRQGRWVEALNNQRKAVELDSGSVGFNGQLVFSFIEGRRWGDALTTQRRVVGLVPDNQVEQSWLAQIAFFATGSTTAGDAWEAGLTPAQRDSPRIVVERKRWAVMRGDHAAWTRLDQMQPYIDDEDFPRWEQAREAAMTFAAHGDWAGARARLGNFPAELRAALELDPANWRLWISLAQMEALLGQKAEAVRDARKAVELMNAALDALQGARTQASFAVACAWAGDKDAAIAELSRQLRVPGGAAELRNVHIMRVGPEWFPLRGDPRFEALLKDPKNNEPLF